MQKHCYLDFLSPSAALCCPECDYGVPDDACWPVRKGDIEIMATATTQDQGCATSVIQYDCDKYQFRSGDKKFRCVPIEGERTVNFENCPINSATYTDVVGCQIIQDPSLLVGCDVVV